MHLNIRMEALQGRGLACWFPAEPQNLEQSPACSRCSITGLSATALVTHSVKETRKQVGGESDG